MTRVTKPLRGQRPTKRLDLSDVKEALRDTRQWTALGVVAEGPDGSPHWEIHGENADVLVEVVMMPDQVPLLCRLAAGMWIVPDVGDEVAVIVPTGEIDFMPVITCILSSGLPSAQGPQPQRIVIVRGEVLIHDGDGGAKELAYKSDVDAIHDYLNRQFDPNAGHVHPPPNPPTQPSPVTESPLVPPVAGGGTCPESEGTTVLKAK